MFYTKRSPLTKYHQAISQGSLSIGFLGGSITEQSAQHNWSDQISVMLKDAYPKVKIRTQNLAIGATTSMLGAIHCISELRDDHDLIFIEYAVNDFHMESNIRYAAREGMLRQIQAKSKADIILIYTYFDAMYPYYEKDKLPPTIREFEILANHYHITSVHVGAYVFDMMKRGLIRYDEWLPDGTHPQYRGSSLYANLVFDCLMDTNLKQKLTCMDIPPLYKGNWSTITPLSWNEIECHGPWIIKETSDKWIHEFLYTSSLTASLHFKCYGRVVLLGNMYGDASAELTYRINHGEMQQIKREKEEWIQGLGWYRVEVLCDFDEPQLIDVEIKPSHGITKPGSITMITSIACVQ